MLLGQRAGHGDPEQSLGIVPLPLQPVEFAGQIECVLVGSADVLDHTSFPDSYGFVVPTVHYAEKAST